MNTQTLWLNNFTYTFKNLLKHKILYFFVFVYIVIFLVFIVILPISNKNEILSGWSIVENNNIAFIMIISSGVAGILVGFIFKETQDNNLDLIISTKTLSKRSCVIIKLLVFLITEICISLLVIITISCFLSLVNGVTTAHILYLFLNIIIVNVIFTLIFGGFALIVTNIGSKVLTVLSPIVLSMAVVIYSIGIDMSKLLPSQQMMLQDNVQTTTVKYFGRYNDPQNPTAKTGLVQTGVYFTSYNPNIQFSGAIAARQYYEKVQSQYSSTDLYANPVRQFALMSNAIGLTNWTERYMVNSFGGTKITNYHLRNLIYAYTERYPLLFVVGTQSTDYNVFMLGNTGTSQKLLSDNIGYLYVGSANEQNLKEFDNYQLMPVVNELPAFTNLYNSFNANIASSSEGAFWNGEWPQGTHVNEYEWLRYYFEDTTLPFKVTNDNDYDLNYRILQFKLFEWYEGCISFRMDFLNNVTNLTNYFKSAKYYKSQWQLQTFAMTQLLHGVRANANDGLFFSGSEYGMGFHTIKLSLFQNVMFGFFDFVAVPDAVDYWLFDVLWLALGLSLLSIGVILYANKDFA